MRQKIEGYTEGIGNKKIYIYINGYKYQVLEAKIIDEKQTKKDSSCKNSVELTRKICLEHLGLS